MLNIRMPNFFVCGKGENSSLFWLISFRRWGRKWKQSPVIYLVRDILSLQGGRWWLPVYLRMYCIGYYCPILTKIRNGLGVNRRG